MRAYDPAVTARDVPNANPRCVAAAQLTISRLQSDLGCVPSDIIGLEVTAVMSNTGSVGTADLALRINNKAVVVDWKTQRTLNEGIAWQLASYATADYWITETDVLQIERPPRVDYEAELLKLMAQTVNATTAEELFAIQNSLSEWLSAQAEPKAPARVILPSGEALEIADTALVVHVTTAVSLNAEITTEFSYALSNASPVVTETLSMVTDAALRVDEQLKRFEGRGRTPLLTTVSTPGPVQVAFGIKSVQAENPVAKPRPSRTSAKAKVSTPAPVPEAIEAPVAPPVQQPAPQQPRATTQQPEKRSQAPAPRAPQQPAPQVDSQSAESSELTQQEKNMLAYIHQFAASPIADEQERIKLARFLEKETHERGLSRKAVVQMYNDKKIVLESDGLVMH